MMIMLAHVIQNFPVYNPLNTYVCIFHVPIFFIISGYVASLSKRSSMSKKRVMALLIPYIIFSCFNSFIKFAVLGIQHALTVDIIRKELVELLITGNGTVWFLVTLLFTELVYIYLLRKIVNPYIRLASCLLMIVVAFILPEAGNPFVIVLYRVICAVGFYGLGYAFEERKLEINSWVIVAAMLVLGLLIEKIFGCGVDFFNGSFTKPVGSIVASILTSFGWIALIRLCDSNRSGKLETAGGLTDGVELESGADGVAGAELNAGRKFTAGCGGIIGKILNYMGSNSIIVMLVHPIVLMVILYPFGDLIRSFGGGMAIVAGLILYVVLCAIQVPCIYIINNYLPFLVGRKK